MRLPKEHFRSLLLAIAKDVDVGRDPAGDLVLSPFAEERDFDLGLARAAAAINVFVAPSEQRVTR